MPVQKMGIEIPLKERNMIALLYQAFGLIEAIIPRGTPNMIEKIMAKTDNSRVAGSLSNTTLSAG